MNNYICIDGKKAELTEEQLKALGIEIKEDNIFELNYNKTFYFINSCGQIVPNTPTIIFNDSKESLHEVANYYTDKELLQQRAYEETLNRLLWRYSMEHDGDKINWNADLRSIYCIRYDHKLKRYDWATATDFFSTFGAPYFYSKEVAKNAIKEIVEPFMRDHPDFIPR